MIVVRVSLRLVDELSSPDQTSLLKGVIMISRVPLLKSRQMIHNAAYWLARGIALSTVVHLRGSLFTPPSVWGYFGWESGRATEVCSAGTVTYL
jgi:hypothetical protein